MGRTYFYSRRERLITACGCIISIFWLIFLGIRVDKVEAKKTEKEKEALEEKLKEDANLHDFDLQYFELVNEDDDKFINFTGNAIKMDGRPVEFIALKYQISQKNYYDLEKFMKQNDCNGAKWVKDLFVKILEMVNEGELVSNNNIKALSTALYDAENGNVLALRNINIPKIYKENGIATYEVELVKYNSRKTTDAQISFIKKQVIVKLTKEIEENPILAYTSDNCKVKTISIEHDKIKNNVPILLTARK